MSKMNNMDDSISYMKDNVNNDNDNDKKIYELGSDEIVHFSGGGIHSGGFSVNSIMMKNGISPIKTMNNSQSGGSNNNFGNVSDLFDNLVLPNWAVYHKNITGGGKYKPPPPDNDSDEDDFIEDDLHEKLLDLVKEHDIKKKNKKTTRKHKSSLKNKLTKNNRKTKAKRRI